MSTLLAHEMDKSPLNTEASMTPVNLAFSADRCVHCQNQIPSRRKTKDTDEARFCCSGCHFVYKLLNAKGLSQYYQLREATAGDYKKAPVNLSQENYAYLDEPEFKAKFCQSATSPTMDFYLEGVHCVACLWLIEKLPSLNNEVVKSRLDLGRAVATIEISEGGSFAKVAKDLESFGYRPHPVAKDQATEDFQKLENRSWLVRLGVAGACAGNIMLLAVSLYAGASGSYGSLFQWLSLLLFLPVATYSASPFYKSAWVAIKTKSLSIDVPISVAIVLGSAVSILHTFQGSDHVYFDSLSALIFLLLSTRYLLRRIQQNTLGQVQLYQFLAPLSATLYDLMTKEMKTISSHLLKVGDIIIVQPGASFPADGIVIEGTSTLNVSLLTGESEPQRIAPGQDVFSGTHNEAHNQDGRLIVKVTAAGAASRLGHILKCIEESADQKAPIVQAADQISKWFLWTVFLSAFAVFILSPHWSIGLNRALAMMIVTCPCALALATPLTMTLALQKAASAGMLIKGADVIERLNRIGTVVLDKTGTITNGHFEVLSWQILQPILNLPNIVMALEKNSKHPIAKALLRYLSLDNDDTSAIIIENAQETTGTGVSGTFNGIDFQIKSLEKPQEHKIEERAPVTHVGVYANSKLVATASLGDKLRDDSFSAIKSLQEEGLVTCLLSGDRDAVVKKAASDLNIAPAFAQGATDPLGKRDFIVAHPRSLMVGDGANDAPALSAAYVSAAVHGSMEVSLRVADVYLSQPGVTPIYQLVTLSKKTMRIIYRNFAFSLAYNFVGGIAAATGYITPLAAALLMPLSAFTVLGSSLLGSRHLLKVKK